MFRQNNAADLVSCLPFLVELLC